MSPVPSDEDNDELLLSCRYGDLDDVKQFVERFGADSLADARDGGGNTVLHMICANGHIDVLDYLLSIINPSLLSAQNDAKSTPLHWAALNSHLAIAQKLVRFSGGPGVDLIDVKNAAGRSPLGEAENAGWEEGAKWFVEVMNLEDGKEDGKGEDDLPVEGAANIEVEIQDAEGQVAKMTIASPQPGAK